MPSKMHKYKQNELIWKGHIVEKNEEIYFCSHAVENILNTVTNVN